MGSTIQGWSVFWDRSSIYAGQDINAVIEQAIEQARCMIVGWSSTSRKSDWVIGEADIGRERGILVPVLFESVNPPIAFRCKHTEDFSAWNGDANAPVFLSLCKALKQQLQPTEPQEDAVQEIDSPSKKETQD